MNEADAGSPSLAEKVREQAEIMRRQVSFYLDRARAAARARTRRRGDRGEAGRRRARPHLREAAWRPGLDLRRRVAAGLSRSAAKRRISPISSATCSTTPENGRAKGCPSHAARAAAAENRDAGRFLHRRDRRRRSRPRQEARAAALERGKRLDESRPGSGLGLSIVVELASIYGGSLRLDESPLGGLRAILRLPCL